MRLRMLLVPAVATVALLAGCTTTPTPEPTSTPTPTTNGLDAIEAEEILSRATEALEAAGSFRITGKGEADGETVEVDAVFAGEQVQGTFSVTGFELEILVTEDGSTYIRGGEDLFGSFLGEEAEALLPLIAGKYVKLPGGEGSSFAPTPEDFITPEGEFTKGEVKAYKGQPAITLLNEDGDELYISLVGEPYPLAVVSTEGTMEFSDFGANVTIEAPADADVFDLSTFTG